MLRVFEIMAFEHIASISLNSNQKTCDRQSTCHQIVLGLPIWLKQMLSNSLGPDIMQNYDEGAPVLISDAFVTHQQVDSPKVV